MMKINYPRKLVTHTFMKVIFSFLYLQLFNGEMYIATDAESSSAIGFNNSLKIYIYIFTSVLAEYLKT